MSPISNFADWEQRSAQARRAPLRPRTQCCRRRPPQHVRGLSNTQTIWSTQVFLDAVEKAIRTSPKSLPEVVGVRKAPFGQLYRHFQRQYQAITGCIGLIHLYIPDHISLFLAYCASRTPFLALAATQASSSNGSSACCSRSFEKALASDSAWDWGGSTLLSQ